MSYPMPVAVNEQLPEPEVACRLLCRVCRRGLFYQRQERPRFLDTSTGARDAGADTRRGKSGPRGERCGT
jgi:hypothetical protein